MNKTETAQKVPIFDAPVLDASQLPKTVPWEDELPHPPRNDWERELQAFLRLRPSLLATHRGQFVAVLGGQAVDSGADMLELAARVRAKHGQVPFFVGQVTERRVVERIPGFRGRPE